MDNIKHCQECHTGNVYFITPRNWWIIIKYRHDIDILGMMETYPQSQYESRVFIFYL